MGSTEFGNFDEFCRDSTLPVCNLLSDTHTNRGFGGCELNGISLKNDQHLGNLGSILVCGLALATTAFLLWRSSLRKAAVGRVEMMLFLGGYALISLCEIFSVGEFPLDEKVRIAFSAIHIGAIIATTWLLLFNAIVGYQIIDDGSMRAVAMAMAVAVCLFVGTGYIALDTGFTWTDEWASSYTGNHRNIALYVLYQLVPLIFLVIFYVLEAILVIRILAEKPPLIPLTLAALFFAIGQVFNYAISKYICDGTNGRIDGALFETLFTLLAVVSVWYFWTMITEDNWQTTYP